MAVSKLMINIIVFYLQLLIESNFHYFVCSYIFIAEIRSDVSFLFVFRKKKHFTFIHCFLMYRFEFYFFFPLFMNTLVALRLLSN